MYQDFYEMTATPFTRGIPSDALYMPPELAEVENRLKYVAERQLFAVLTGDCGTGKTTQNVLNHYDRAQTEAYIRNHLACAGVTNEIFTEAAMDGIHQYTAGTARMIDKVCTSILLYGSQSHLRLIDDRTVKLVLECEFS